MRRVMNKHMIRSFLVFWVCLSACAVAYGDKNQPIPIVVLKQISAAPAQGREQQSAVNTSGQFFGRSYTLETIALSSEDEIRKAFHKEFKRGIREFIVAVNLDTLLEIVDSKQGKQSWFYNLDPSKSRARNEHCRSNVANIITGHAMRPDALLNAAILYAIRSKTLETREQACE